MNDGRSQSPLGRPALLVAVGGAGLLTLIVLIALMLVTLKQSHDHIQAQNHKLAVLLGEGRPLLRQSDRLLRDARGAFEPIARDGRGVVDAASTLPETADAVTALATTAVPLLRALGDVRAPAVVEQLSAVATVALSEQRLERLIDGTNELIAAVQAERLVPKLEGSADAVSRIERLQTRTLAVLEESLAVQRETLSRVRSLDRKTGGTPPAVAPAPQGPPAP